ncbi:hypothetical protein D9758_010078 [Tetrapyrgos nigripes]|uniref:Uncharacterized protein n=1 Tax=Tetrapyrgos nigripes TaxID=182062 RepID=A0A8H5C652_9AGAR|nr:hypothetical protein D9758_014301 [Tetrapyrgos nigripes]KAF5348015.1 hypothetical protein D9758_010078 [Tetrapyrgos nigripes]
MLIAQGAHTSSSPFLKIIVTGSFGTLPPFTYMRATPADAPTLLKEVDSATRPLDEAPAPLLSTGTTLENTPADPLHTLVTPKEKPLIPDEFYLSLQPPPDAETTNNEITINETEPKERVRRRRGGRGKVEKRENRRHGSTTQL